MVSPRPDLYLPPFRFFTLFNRAGYRIKSTFLSSFHKFDLRRVVQTAWVEFLMGFLGRKKPVLHQLALHLDSQGFNGGDQVSFRQVIDLRGGTHWPGCY